MKPEVLGMMRLALGFLVLLAAVAPAFAAAPPVQVGQIYVIDVGHSFVLAEFPDGRRLINIDRRDLWRYRVGDEIRVDSFGRPQS
ncbi:MAG TPA: hypothetical protein VID04_03700 [Methylomirabilota bacterium]